MSEEIQRLFIEAKKEMEMPKEELLEKLWDLQQRIDKAVEYINDFPLIHYSSVEKVNEKRLSGKLVPIDDLLEILRGKDEN